MNKHLAMLQRNRELSEKSAFVPVNHHMHYFVNRHTNKDLLHFLVVLAQRTQFFALEVSFDMNSAEPALIQIEMIHKAFSTIVSIEVCHLPEDPLSLQFWLIKALVKKVLNGEKTIYTWGDGIVTLAWFSQCQLFPISMLVANKKNFVNVQKEFQQRHPQTIEWELHEAVAHAFDEFLDQKEKFNTWSKGFDLPKKHTSDQILDQQPRIEYLVHTCQAITKLAHRMDKDIFQ